MITPKELRESQPSPLYDVKQLMLEACFTPTRYEINQLVDALLWISPLLENLSIEWRDRDTFKCISLKVWHIYVCIYIYSFLRIKKLAHTSHVV